MNSPTVPGYPGQVSAALSDTYRGPWVYAPGEMFADLAAAVADGADCIDAVGQLCGDEEHAFGAKASTTTMWLLADQRIDAAHLPGARAAARASAWAAGAAPTSGDRLHIDIDADLVIDHFDNKHGATPTWKTTFGHHPLLAFWTAPRSPVVKPWPGCCAPAPPAPTPPANTSSSSPGRWQR